MASQIEKTAIALDELAARRKVNSLPAVDFEAYMHTRQQDKDNVKRPHEFADEVLAKFGGGVASGATMPWTKTHEQVRFRSGEVSLWSGYNGHKKSMVLGYISLAFMQQKEPVCVASLEMRPASTVARMVKQAAGTATPTHAALDKFLEFADGSLWLYDQQGSIAPERIYGVIYYAAEQLGIKHFIVDSLMRVISGTDNYNAQKDFIVRLCEIAKETQIHIHLVAHNKKPPNGDESKPAGRYESSGTADLSNNVHNAFNIWSKKDKSAENELPDVVIKCDKQREGEWEGAIGLWFEPESLQFSGTPDIKVRSWIR